VGARSACTFPKRREQLGQGTDSPSRMTVGSLVIVCLRPIWAAACDSPRRAARRAHRRGRDAVQARLRRLHADDCRGHELLRSLASTLGVSVAPAGVKRRHPGRVIAPVAQAPAPYIFVVCQPAHFSFLSSRSARLPAAAGGNTEFPELTEAPASPGAPVAFGSLTAALACASDAASLPASLSACPLATSFIDQTPIPLTSYPAD
jgi:hypothetical protein